MRQGLYEGLYSSGIRKEDACKILGVDSNCFVLLFYGAIAPYKGIDKLLYALRSYNKNNIRVIIAGSALIDNNYG